MRIPPGLISGLLVLVALLAGLRPGPIPTCASWIRPHAAAADDVDRTDLTFTAHDGLTLCASRPTGSTTPTRSSGWSQTASLGALVLYGHSLGGLATALYAIERGER